uniref:Uncharacterized protein n=1 Tax=Hippocampus comes TaxID=109280 RepID=A0A3Q2XI10_HIPCM
SSAILSGNKRLMDWGSIAPSGPGLLALFNGTIISAIYQKILRANIRQHFVWHLGARELC